MTGFSVFMLYLLALWVVVMLTERPLQPDQPEDELADVDMTDVHRQRVVREACWWESPSVNIVLSRRRRG